VRKSPVFVDSMRRGAVTAHPVRIYVYLLDYRTVHRFTIVKCLTTTAFEIFIDETHWFLHIFVNTFIFAYLVDIYIACAFTKNRFYAQNRHGCREASLLRCSLGLSEAPLWVPWAFLGFLGADVVEIYVICALSGQISSVFIVGSEFLDVKVSVFIKNWSAVDSKTLILLQTWRVTQVMPNTFP